MPSPLNPTLYGRLREEFGRVQISHAGIAATKQHSRDLFSDRLKLRIDSAGEYYRVNCPYCNDTRGRLWINHLWGVPDEVTGSKNLWLGVCYNEDCLAHPGRPYELYDRVLGFKNAGMRGIERIIVLPGEVEEASLREVPLPGVTIRFDRMPINDPACLYLRERGFDPVELGTKFDVCYCLDANSNFPIAHGRIIVPVIMRGLIVGWQGRYVGDLDWKATGIPKYYNLPNMPRRLMLYNFDQARNTPFVVITEGPFDAMSVGEPATAAFGKHLSAAQVQLICENWAGGAVVILLDGDAWEDTEKLAERFRQEQFKGTVIPVRLPGNKDPGELSRSFIWECIDDTCRQQGINLLTLERNVQHEYNSRGGLPYRCPRTNDEGGRNLDAQRSVPQYSFDRPGDAATRS